MKTKLLKNILQSVFCTVILLSFHHKSYANETEVIVVDGVNKWYFAADIFSAIPQSIVNLFYESRTKSYLKDSIHEFMPATSLESFQITPFLWDGSPGFPGESSFEGGADETISDIIALAQLIDSKSNNGQKPLVVVAHSWGTFLTYYALKKTVTTPDLVVFLSSPLGSKNAHQSEPFFIGGESFVVDYTNRYSDYVESRITGSARAQKFINFWAWRDVISGPIYDEIVATSVLNYQVDKFVTDALGYRAQDRTLLRYSVTGEKWHSYTALETDHNLGSALNNDIKYLLEFESNNPAGLQIISPNDGEFISSDFEMRIYQPLELKISAQLINLNGVEIYYSGDRENSPIRLQISLNESAYENIIDVIWADKFLNEFVESITVFNDNYSPSADDWIRSLRAYPNPAIQGNPFALIAENVVHPENRRIDQVEFYRDSNGSNALEEDSDDFVGRGREFQGDWILDYNPTLPEGNYRFFARARDELGNESSTVMTVAKFEFAPATAGNDFDLRSSDWQDNRGDDDGVLEGFEEVTLDIRLENESSSVLYDVSASISSTYGSQLVITDDTVKFSTFDSGEVQWDRGDFEFRLDAPSANNIEFNIRVLYTKNGLRHYQDFSLDRDFYQEGSRAPNFEIVNYNIDDSPSIRTENNGDGVFDSGEKVRLRPHLRNSGNADASDVDLRLTWEGTGIDAFSDIEPYGDINDGQTSLLDSDDYYTVRSERAFSGTVDVDFEVTWDESETSLIVEDGFQLNVNGIGWLDAEWTNGNEDTNFGILSPGSLLEETLTVQNRGAGALTVSAITTSNADTTISGVTLPTVIPAGESLAVPVTFDSTGLNQTVMREITIETDGRNVDDAGLSSSMTLILAGTVTEVSGGGLSVLGSFLTGVPSVFSPHLVAAKAGNLDGDEYLDFAVFEEDVPGTDGSVPTLFVYEEDGAGGIVERWNSGSMFANMNVRWDTYPLAIEDFNGDGVQEIVLAVFSTDSGGGYGTNGVLHVFSRTGTDLWTSVYSGYTNQGRLLDVITGDWDKDGRKEIVLTTSVGSSSSIASRRCRLYVIESNGAFGFSQIYSITDIPSGGTSRGEPTYLRGFSGLTIADSDLDGFNELIFAAGHPENDGGADNEGDQLFIYEATGNNAFTKRFSGLSYDGPNFDDLWDFAVIAVGDPDRDGKNELILADEDSKALWIWEISGNNTWVSDIRDSNYEFRETSFAQEGYSIAIGNVDSDENIEIVFGTDNSVSPNAFVLESFTEDSYYIDWSTSIAGDNPMSLSIVENSQFGSPVIFWGVTTEGLFVVGEGSTSTFDLVLFSSGISLSEKATESEASTLYATVSNPLSDATPAFDVSFYLGDPQSGGALIATETVAEGIDGNSSVDVTVPWTPLKEGPANVFVIVDEEESVTEFDETNNQASRVFTIEDSDLSGPSLNSFVVEELNGDGDGIIGADESIRVSWELDDSSGISETSLWFGDSEVSSITGNVVTIDSLAPGSYTLTLRASDGDASPESSEFRKEFSVVTAETIQISVNGRTLPSGNIEAQNLGVANVGTALNATIRIENTGEQSLFIRSVDVASPFGIISEDNLIINPEGSQIFRLESDTSQGGVFSGNFVIVDYDNETVSVPLTYATNDAPVIEIIGDKEVDEGSVFEIQVSVTDDGLSGAPFQFGLPNHPTGMSIDSDGRVRWTPSEHQGPNDYTVFVQVSDGMDTDIREFNISVSEVNEAPVLTPIGAKSVNKMSELGFTVQATDSDFPVQNLIFSLQGAPGGATIDAETGEFGWVPSNAQGLGTYSFNVEVTDGEVTVSETITVTVREVNTARASAGFDHSHYALDGGSLWTMGSNFYGQLGDGTTDDRTAPVKIENMGVTSVSGGRFHAVYINDDGSLWATGGNDYGQLGNGDTTQQETPVQIVSSGVVQVTAGRDHTLFIKEDGSLWATGRSHFGQLGSGDNQTQRSPVQIESSGVVYAAAGREHSSYVKSDGSLWAMGRNQFGQLGDGTQVDRLSPVQIVDSGVIGVWVGDAHSLFLKSDGSLWAVGRNHYGQLGDGSTVNREVPVLVESSGVLGATTGEFHSAYVKTDGSLWTMGWNEYGQLGDGSKVDRTTPVQVESSGVKFVSGGFGHTLYAKTNGGIWGMGKNNFGQLGDGSKVDRTTPVQIDVDDPDPSGVQLHLALDANLLDSSVNELHATGQNVSATTDRSGNPSGAMLWNRGEVTVSHRELDTLIDDDFTIAVWVKGDPSGLNYPTRLWKKRGWTDESAVNAIGHRLQMNQNGSVRYTHYVYDEIHVDGAGVAQQALYGNIRVDDGEWHHTAVVREGGTIRLYVDGLLQEDAELPAGEGANQENMTIGWAGSEGFNISGALDDFLFYADALSANEVAGLASIGPKIEAHPLAQTVVEGDSVSFTVSISDSAEVSYQWRKDGTPISGASAASYDIALVELSDAGSYDVVVSNSIGSVTSNTAILTVKSRPVLSPVGDKSVAEEAELRFTVNANDPDTAQSGLTFKLINAPDGASIDSVTGEFSWTPSEEQGPDEFSFSIEVSDGELTDSETIKIAVTEVNKAPVLAPIGSKSTGPLSELFFVAVAADTDIPEQTLIFSLSGEPNGASIDPSSGEFTWTPTEAQAGEDYSFSIGVTDGDIPDEEEITVTVSSAPDGLFAQIAEFPVGLNASSMAAAGNTLFIFGGRVDGASTGSTKIYQWDSENPSFVENTATLPYGMGWGLSSTAASNGKIYLGPARGPSSGGGFGSRSNIVEFDPSVPSSSELSVGYPSSTWDTTADSDLNGDVYFFGGHTGGDLRSISRLDVSTGKFESAGQLPWADNSLYSISDGIGGIYLISWEHRKVARYIPDTEIVEILADVPADYVAASSNDMAWVDGQGNCFFIFRELESELMALFKYDAAQSQVEKLGAVIPAALRGGASARIGDDVYLLGGDKSGLNKSYLYRINVPAPSNHWKPELGDSDIVPVGVTIGAGSIEGSTSWEFDGSSYLNGPADHVIFGESPPLGHTVLMAFKTTTDRAILFGTSDSSGYDGFIPVDVSFSGGQLRVGGRYSSPGHIDWGITQNAESTFNDGEWHTLAVVLDQSNGEARLYLDGQSQGTETISSTADYTDGGTIRIGASRFQGTLPHAPFTGSLSDFAVHAGTWSESEIQAWSQRVVPTTDLVEVARYSFEDSLVDSVGGRDGASAGGEVSYVDGPAGGKALQMPNIANHRVSVPVYPLGAESFVVSAWIRMEDEDSWFTNANNNRPAANILTYQTGDFSQGFILGLAPSTETDPDRLYSTYDPGSVNNGKFNVELTDLHGKWIHVAAAVDVESNVRRLYVNGELSKETAITSAGFAAAEGFIGAYKYSSARNGNPQHVSSGIKIDDLRVFTGVATTEDIKRIAGSSMDVGPSFIEDWESGSIDTDVWHIWGSPVPALRTGGNAMGSFSMENNGDGSWHSGVTTKDTFRIVPGLRVTSKFYTQNRGTPYDRSSNTMSLDTRDLSYFAASGASVGTDPLLPSVQQRANGTISVGDSPAGVPLGSISTNDAWHEFTFQFNENGSVTYLMDGQVIHTSAAGWIDYETIAQARLALHGRSEAVVNLVDAVSIRIGSVNEAPPSIITQPSDQTVNEGASVTLSVSALGENLTYQWRNGGNAINGATSATLELANVQEADEGSYDVVVTNGAGSVTSNPVLLTVNAPPPTGVTATLIPVGAEVYSPAGGKIAFTASINYPESTPTALGWAIQVPVGFSFSRIVSGSAPPVVPSTGETGALEFAYTGVPSGSVSFVLELAYASGLTGTKTITGAVEYRSPAATIPVTPITLDPVTPPSITAQPTDQVAMVGGNISLTVEAEGSTPLTYQWSQNDQPITDAESASFMIDPVQMSSAGEYQVVVTNAAGTVTSVKVELSVLDLVAAHEVAGSGYLAGGTVTINNTITYIGTLGGLGYSVLLPDAVGGVKWSYVSSDGEVGSVQPGTGTTDLLEWAWTSVPAEQIEFSYTLDVPAGTMGEQTIAAMVLPRFNSVQLEGLVLPDPLSIEEAPSFHTADMNGDLKISLTELLRVIELYNTRFGTTRTGRYLVEDGTEDGFAADLVTPSSEAANLTRYHAADFNQDAKISLTELLRVIELYNYREGTTRTGRYHVEEGTEDGYASGPEL